MQLARALIVGLVFLCGAAVIGFFTWRLGAVSAQPGSREHRQAAMRRIQTQVLVTAAATLVLGAVIWSTLSMLIDG